MNTIEALQQVNPQILLIGAFLFFFIIGVRFGKWQERQKMKEDE